MKSIKSTRLQGRISFTNRVRLGLPDRLPLFGLVFLPDPTGSGT